MLPDRPLWCEWGLQERAFPFLANAPMTDVQELTDSGDNVAVGSQNFIISGKWMQLASITQRMLTEQKKKSCIL